MPVCGQPGWMDCAHEASRALLGLGYDLRNKGTANCSACKHPIRAHDIGKWARNYPQVTYRNAQDTYLVYQVRNIDNQGHVFVYSKGQCMGNGNYNWVNTNSKGGIIRTRNFKLN